VILPWCISVTAFTIARPSPAPVARRAEPALVATLGTGVGVVHRGFATELYSALRHWSADGTIGALAGAVGPAIAVAVLPVCIQR
jgi:hypothetical protein